jgi:hypothetical protein
LWEVTHSRLDLYHQIATGQARRSFLAAQAANRSARRCVRRSRRIYQSHLRPLTGICRRPPARLLRSTPGVFKIPCSGTPARQQ